MRSRVRWLLIVLGTAITVGAATSTAGAAGGAAESRPTVVRKSASDMTPAEISRFRRAFSYAVRKGYLDDFNAEHFNRTRNRQHGSDILAGAPPAAAAGESPAWGLRLLPWHRAFILEAERMIRSALRERDRAEGRDPREARRVFIPYWDAAGDQRLPLWVRTFKPRGGTGIVPEDIPKGHAAYGKPVGSRYRIRFARYPGGNILFDKLPPQDQVGRMLARTDFNGFLQALDVVPELVQSALPGAKVGLQTLTRKLPGNADLQRVIAATDPNYPKDAASQLAAFNSLMAVGYEGTSEAARRNPDRALIAAVEAVFAAFRFPPHLVLHFWAGGLDPDNPDVRGTVTYFNELTVDPVFWMLHTELDRYWYTWEQSHTTGPSLQGADAVFQPMTRREAAFYGGGRAYQLAELMGPQNLPYRYAASAGTAAAAQALGTPRAASPFGTATVSFQAPSISTAGGSVCRLLGARVRG
jgi:hypothetical protein